MSAYELETILNKWEKGTITTEQTVGQILLLIESLSQRIGNVEKHLVRQRRGLDIGVKEAKEKEERPPADTTN